MRYGTLLFDIDNTLLDFDLGEQRGLKLLFEGHGIPFTEEVFSHYSAINRELWNAYEQGTKCLDEVLNTRFSLSFAGLGKTVDGAEWERQYRVYLGESHFPIEGAVEMCEKLSANHRMYIVTNGVRKTQLKRLYDSGLDKYFDEVFDSESIGAQKPSGAFFDYVIAHIDNFVRKDTLLIGDSQTTDIAGGNSAGIDTCWYNKAHTSDTAKITAKYKICSLYDLEKIV